MFRTLVELGVAPALVAVSTIVARRWGSRAGGVISAFPAIVGPVLLILALSHGRAFAAQAANGTLLGLVALSAFALAYGRVALGHGWRASLIAGWLSAAVAALAVGVVARGAGSPAGLLVAAVSLAVARRALPSVAPAAPTTVTAQARRGAIPARMATAALLVTSLSAAAGALGALAGGMLAALPVLACVLVVFAHREEGAPAAIALLRGLLVGMASFVVFCQLIALLIGPYGIAPAFTVATVAALAVQAMTVYPPFAVQSLLRRQSSAARLAVAAAAGSLRRQSS